jgi:hypothetical protein
MTRLSTNLPLWCKFSFAMQPLQDLDLHHPVAAPKPILILKKKVINL